MFYTVTCIKYNSPHSTDLYEHPLLQFNFFFYFPTLPPTPQKNIILQRQIKICKKKKKNLRYYNQLQLPRDEITQ